MPTQAGPVSFRAYTGLGTLFAMMLSVPGLAFALLLFGYLVVLLGYAVAAWVGLLFFAAWIFVVGRSFVPVDLEPTGAGLITHFFRLHRVAFSPWSETELYHLKGALYAIGTHRAWPISWAVVRRHDAFFGHVSEHLITAKPRG